MTRRFEVEFRYSVQVWAENEDEAVLVATADAAVAIDETDVHSIEECDEEGVPLWLKA